MPKDLAALLVENGAVPADVVERAIGRQQAAGGTLDTALLELGVPEDDLAGWLARAAELPAAPADAWTASDPRARRVFPSRVAERHGLAPFALDGRELSLVATYPVDLGLLDEISFMLSLHLTAHVGPEWRVRELIHRIYGSPLAPRLAALAGVPGGTEAAPTSAEPQAEPIDPPSPRAAGGGVGGGVELVAEHEPERVPEPEQRRPPPSAAALAGFGAGDEPMEPLAAALAEALESVDFSDFEEEPPAPEDGGASEPAAAPAQAQAEPGAEAPVAEEVAANEEPPPPPDRTAPPHWNLDDARAALAAASHRDELVLAALRYARDFFEFAAMFAVTRDAVAGHDGLGIEEARERVRAVAIWANDPGVFKTVIDTQSPYLGPAQAGAAGTDAVLHGLSRTPRTVLVYPILLRDRPICILYADNGEAPVSPRRLGDLLLFLSTVGPAFERIIRDRKKRRRRRTMPPPGIAAAEAPPPAPEPVHEPAPEAAPGPVEVAPEPRPEPVDIAPAPERAEVAPAPADAAAPPDAVTPLEPLPPEPELPPVAAAASPPSAPGEADEPERELSFAILEEQGDAEPAPAPPPAPGSAQADPGRTAILWPQAHAPSESPSDPWDAAQQAVEAEAAAARSPPAESLGALEDRFFAGSGDEAAPAAVAPETPAHAEPAAAQAVPEASPSTPPAVAVASDEGTPSTPETPATAEPTPRQRPAPPRGPPPVAAPPDPASLTALADRALDADPEVAAAACAALGNRRRDPAIRPAAEKLRRALLSGIAARATRAARAIGELRDLDSIPLLIQVLETSEPETAKAASGALAAITLQRHGPDARRWLAWWKENRGRGRAEWLFSALTSPDRELRVAASLELSHAAPPPVAYTADMPPPEREKAARAWAGWWARSGHVL